MALSKKSKVIISSFVIGFLIILLSQIVTATINFLFVKYQFTHLSFDELKNLSSSFNSQLIGWINLLIKTAAFIFAGYFVNRRIKEKGWLYGGTMGLIWFTFVLLISLIPFLLPKDLIYGPNFPDQMAKANMDKRLTSLISGIPLGLMKTLLLTTLGGFLGGYLVKRAKS